MTIRPTPQPFIERLICQYGESYRRLIIDAIAFLDKTEPTWKLDTPIDRQEYVADLIRKAK